MSLLDCVLITLLNAAICITIPKILSVLASYKAKATETLSNSNAAITESELTAQPSIAESPVIP